MQKKIQEQENQTKPTVDYTEDYPRFDPAGRGEYTILVPDMLPWHFDIIRQVVAKRGYKMEVLKNDSRAVIDEGLKHVHNDTCYPALCVIGQYIDALKSGKYDPDKTAVMITQSGGGCRASNYVPLIRKALKAEFPQVPVLSLNFAGLEKGNSIEVDLSLLLELAFAIFYGDSLMTLYNQTKPYEVHEGDADRARTDCFAEIGRAFEGKGYLHYKKLTKKMIGRFGEVERRKEKKVRVGIVGEIYVKYSPLGNSHLEAFLLSEGCEPVVPALMDFVLYCIVNNINDTRLYGRTKKMGLVYSIVYKVAYHIQKQIISVYKKDGRFEPPHDFEHLRRCADKVINQGVKMGEGWLIPAEMAALAETGTENIVCAQPFGCLPNHIAGKGAVRAVKALFPDENVVAIDYDSSASRVNQENRIKLMLATARENLKNKEKSGANY
ncbi:MAG TPA: 2-hydroxyacyl-CoA dehydratase [Candidatus Scatosoma pullicola]|nr:2-hydroxyacyl-CoA dehydratase [Candidatus Scatosoma pullicola]